eukprot:COSAG01_NODE_20545_length_948_cov_1.479388_2_plen_247_part_01
MTSVSEFCAELAKVHGPCHRKIHVEVDPEDDKKMQHGERNNMSQDQIRDSPGEGNTYSIFMNHCPNLMCIDLDTKQLENCELWSELVTRDCLRVETRKGWHCYLRTQAPFDSCKLNALNGVSGDIMYGSGNNVWETDSRVLTGTLQDIEWSEIAPHVELSKPGKPGKPGKRKQPAPADHKPIPQCLAAYVAAKYPTVQGCTYKLDTQTVSKRRGTQTITTETPIDCWSLNLGHKCPFTGQTHNNHVM